MFVPRSEKIEQEGESEKDLYAFLAGLAGAIIDSMQVCCASKPERFCTTTSAKLCSSMTVLKFAELLHKPTVPGQVHVPLQV